MSSVIELLALRAAAHADRTPINVAGTLSLTYGAWDRRSNAAAHALLGRGVRPGDRVLLLFGGLDWVDYAIAYFGVLKAGATAVHVNDQEPESELRRRIGQCAPVGIVHGPASVPPGVACWTSPAGALDGPETPVGVPIGPDAIADILYTSGTTGPAKPFTNPHGNLAYGRGPASVTTFDDTAPMLAPMPLGTTSSSNIIGIFALATPNTIIVCRPEDAERIGALIQRHRVSSVMFPPWLAMRLVAAEIHKRYDLTSVTSIGTASAHMPSAVARALLEMMPNAGIHTAYAQSEAVPAVILNNYRVDRPLCLGRPGPGTELRVVGPNGGPLPVGELGEVWVRSAAPKRLYLDPELNREVHADGWTRTRDLGYVGEDGLLHLFDRAADAIRSRGRLVSSIEVEDVLMRHPAVAEVAVFGVPDPDPEVGHAVVAAVVPAGPGEIDPAALTAFAAERLAEHQVPAAIQPVPSLPRTVSGKVRKQLLRQRYPLPAGDPAR